MLNFENFWKCTPEMYPCPFQISEYKYITGVDRGDSYKMVRERAFQADVPAWLNARRSDGQKLTKKLPTKSLTKIF